MTVNEQLKALRQSRGLTLRAVQEMTGISNAYLSQLERGKRKIPSVNIAEKLCRAYGTTIGELLHSGISNTKEPNGAFILSAYSALSEENKRAVKNHIMYLLDQEGKGLPKIKNPMNLFKPY